MAFDPAAYKETMRAQWQETAEAWNRWGPTLEAWLGDATERMLDLAGVGPGSRVLDVAAGAGGEAQAAARRGASVLATDISDAILGYACGAGIATSAMDAENLDLADGTFDAVVSRLGMRTSRKGGCVWRSSGACCGPAVASAPSSTRNPSGTASTPFRSRSSVSERSCLHRRRDCEAPSAPSGSASSSPKQASLTSSSSALRRPCACPRPRDCARLERESFGGLQQMLAGLDGEARAGVWAEIEAELRRFEGPDGFVGPCELLVAAGAA